MSVNRLLTTTIRATLIGSKIVIGKLAMRTRLGITVFVWLTLSLTGLAQKAPARYTTLVIQYSGDMIGGPALPVVITTSQEGEWYSQHVLPELSGSFAKVQVVPQSVLDEITELPLLERALENAKPVDNELKTNQNARFTAGVGYDHGQIILDKQPSVKILKGIDRIVAKYPSLKSGLQELEYQLK